MEKVKKEKNIYRKYLNVYLSVTFGLSWGICLLYIFLHDWIAPIMGELTTSNPLVIIGLNAPSITGILIYFLYGRFSGLGKFLRTLIPRRRDLIWFPIIIVGMICMLIAVRLICILIGIGVPEMTYGPKKMLTEFLKNFYEETGMLGGAWGWFGFLLMYYHRSFKNNIKAGLLAGLMFGIFLLPGSVFSSFETAQVYPLYLTQCLLLGVIMSYILNATKGNVLFFILFFWFACSGVRLQFYTHTAGPQIIQIVLYVVICAILYFVFKSKNANKPVDEVMEVFPDFIER